jgi:DNA ligase-1
MIKKPMLASNDAITVDAKGVAHDQKDWLVVKDMFPMYISVKLDGIRCLKHPVHGPCSREFKTIPNQHIRTTLLMECPEYLDSEIVTYNADGTMREFNDVQGDVMRQAGEPDFKLHVFDYFLTPGQTFEARFAQLLDMEFDGDLPDFVSIVPHKLVYNSKEIEAFTKQALLDGYEGAMLRMVGGIYKEGRSTLKQGWLLKVKHYLDAEGTVIGFEERMKNTNPKTKDKLGKSVRSSHKAGKVPTGTLGKFVLDTKFGELRVGTGRGLNDKLRQEIWDNQDKYMGKTITFAYQPHGTKTLPRIPIFKGFREMM